MAFPRSVAQELLLCASLAFVAGSDVSVPYLEQIFATDASLQKAAITSRHVSPSAARIAWLGGDKKGCYTKLDNPFAAAFRSRGLEDDPDEQPDLPQPTSGLDFAFDFVEICGGSGVVSEHAARLGLIVCTPIELSDSPTFRLRKSPPNRVDLCDASKRQIPICHVGTPMYDIQRRSAPMCEELPATGRFQQAGC